MISELAVHQFLRTYLLSFGDLSGESMAAHYHLPSVMTRADGSVHCFLEAESARVTLSDLTKAYIAQGARAWRYENLDVVPIGRRSILASVDWHMLDSHEGLLRSWRHSYNLVESAEHLIILAATFNVP